MPRLALSGAILVPNGPATDDGVALGENGRLPAGHAVGGLVPLEVEAVRVRGDGCADSRRAVSELHVRAVNADVEPPQGAHMPTLERRTRSHADGVRRRVGVEHVQRAVGGDADSLALAGSEAPEAIVLADLGAVLVDDCAGAGLEAVPPEERAVIVAAEEARLLALGAMGCSETGALRLGARLLLALLAERERNAIEEPRIEAREHVRLVLVRVGAAREQQATAVLGDARVVPR